MGWVYVQGSTIAENLQTVANTDVRMLTGHKADRVTLCGEQAMSLKYRRMLQNTSAARTGSAATITPILQIILDHCRGLSYGPADQMLSWPQCVLCLWICRQHKSSGCLYQY